MQVTIRRATPGDAEAISAIWEVVCAERVYTAVDRPFTPQQEREYLFSLSDREGIFLAEVEGRAVGFQTLDLWAKYTRSFRHVGSMGTIILPEWRQRGIGRSMGDTRTSCLWSCSCEWTEGLFPIPHRPSCRPNASPSAG